MIPVYSFHSPNIFLNNEIVTSISLYLMLLLNCLIISRLFHLCWRFSSNFQHMMHWEDALIISQFYLNTNMSPDYILTINKYTPEKILQKILTTYISGVKFRRQHWLFLLICLLIFVIVLSIYLPMVTRADNLEVSKDPTCGGNKIILSTLKKCNVSYKT